MKKEKSIHGFGLAVFSLLVLGFAFIGVLSGKRISVIASILSLLSLILAIAAYVEARRTNGLKKFALISIVLAVIGTFLILHWNGTIANLPHKKNDGKKNPPVLDTSIHDASKLIEKAEELEKDSLK